MGGVPFWFLVTCATGTPCRHAEGPQAQGSHTASKKPRRCAPWIGKTAYNVGIADTTRKRKAEKYGTTTRHLGGPEPSERRQRRHLSKPRPENFPTPPSPTGRSQTGANIQWRAQTDTDGHEQTQTDTDTHGQTKADTERRRQT